MRIMQVLLWENQRRESIIIRDDSDTIKEKFINQYIDKHVPGYAKRGICPYKVLRKKSDRR